MKVTTIMPSDDETMAGQISTTRESQSSIEVSRSTKGIYSWTVKRYFDQDDADAVQEAFEEIKKWDKKLSSQYGSTKEE